MTVSMKDLLAAGARGLSVEVSQWDSPDGVSIKNAKPVKFTATVMARSGNGNVVAHGVEPNGTLAAAKDLWMDIANRKPKKVNDDGMDLV